MGGPIDPTREGLYVNMILHGDPGSGKTILAATSPNVLILDVDPGIESAVAQGLKPKVWPVSDYNDLVEAYEYLRNEDHDFEWVWIDSATIFQERALHDQIMRDLVIAKPHLEEFVPSMREYLINQNHFAKLVRHFVGLPMHFGMTAYTEAYDIGEDEKVFLPMLQGGKGAYSIKLCGYVNLIGYLGVAKTKGNDDFKNRLLVRRTGRYYAKDRFDALEPVIENPNMTQITETIQKSLAS